LSLTNKIIPMQKASFRLKEGCFIKRLIRDSGGLTVIELLIALLLLGVVLAVGYNFFSYSNTAFLQGGSQSNVQRDISMAGDTITRELRNATKVSNTAPTGEALYYCLRVDASHNLLLETVTNGATSSKKLCSGIVNGFTCSISGANYPYVLTFTLRGQDSNMNAEYVITSNVMLNNVTQSASLTNSIYYTKP